MVWGFFGADFTRTHEKQIEADGSHGFLSIDKIVLYLGFMILDPSSGASSKQIDTCGVERKENTPLPLNCRDFLG